MTMTINKHVLPAKIKLGFGGSWWHFHVSTYINLYILHGVFLINITMIFNKLKKNVELVADTTL